MEFAELALGKGILTFLLESILQDHLIHDLATENASPSEKLFTYSIEFLEYHCSAAPITLHYGPPFVGLPDLSAIFIPKDRFTQKIDKLTILKKWRIAKKYCFGIKFV